MKTITIYTIMAILLTSCASTYNEIGGLSMLADRHVDPNGHYKKLATAAGATKKEIKSTSADDMKSAINQVIAKVPGGLFLTNVKIYVVNGDYLAVSGDVWGYTGDSKVADTKEPVKKPQPIVLVSGTH